MSTSELRSAESTIRFAVFEVDLRTRQLRKNGVRIHVQEQPFSLLLALLSQAGQIVTREELRRRIWPGTSFGDFDHGLNKAVNKLRLALGDSADTPRFIETLAKRGYRFLAPVISPSGLFCSDGRLRLAVIPLRSPATDIAAERFADGLTEELLARFAKADGKRLAVISRSSVHSYAAKTIRQINSDLKADYVIEGLVRTTDQRIRVSVRLIKAHDEVHVWAEIFDRQLEDMFAVQDELAKLITQAVVRVIAAGGDAGDEARLSENVPDCRLAV